MGLFKKLFGDAVDEMKKNLEDSKREMLKSLNETKREALGNLGIKSSEAFKSDDEDVRIKIGTLTDGEQPRKQRAKTNTESTPKEEDYKMKLWWVENLDILFNGEKYALKYKYQSKSEVTRYIYDDVEILNRYQARLAQKKQDGSIRYGVVVSNGWKFFVTDCDYVKVTYLDGGWAVKAIDEDGDEYAIGNYGDIDSIELYREKVQEEMQEQ